MFGVLDNIKGDIKRQVVPEGGVEPPRCCHRRILSPLRLPFRHSGIVDILSHPAGYRKNDISGKVML